MTKIAQKFMLIWRGNSRF